MIGQHYEDSHLAAGFGNHMARPLFREKHTDDMSEEEGAGAHRGLPQGVRDARQVHDEQVSGGQGESWGGARHLEPFAVATNWGYEKYRNPSQFAPGTW